MANALFCVCR